jgi:mono/diheme cytochrome c family protein
LIKPNSTRALLAGAVIVGIAMRPSGLTAQAPSEAELAAPPPGVVDAQRAWQNWTLNCQGCHRLDGTGSEGTAPSLAGTTAKFLWAPGGREYLIRVPGVATSPLSSEDLAEVVNWMLWRFDKEHMPRNFQPFTAAEVARWRTQPLRLEAAKMRSDLLAKAEASGPP